MNNKVDLIWHFAYIGARGEEEAPPQPSRMDLARAAARARMVERTRRRAMALRGTQPRAPPPSPVAPRPTSTGATLDPPMSTAVPECPIELVIEKRFEGQYGIDDVMFRWPSPLFNQRAVYYKEYPILRMFDDVISEEPDILDWKYMDELERWTTITPVKTPVQCRISGILWQRKNGDTWSTLYNLFDLELNISLGIMTELKISMSKLIKQNNNGDLGFAIRKASQLLTINLINDRFDWEFNKVDLCTDRFILQYSFKK